MWNKFVNEFPNVDLPNKIKICLQETHNQEDFK